jgi:hypothetical protein
MRNKLLAGAVFIASVCASLCGASAAFGAGWSASCGQEGKAPCTFSAAKLEFKQSGLCASGQFFDLIDGGTCWTCPSGYGRTVFAVNTDKACEKVASTDFRSAIENGKGTGFFGTDCPSGQFWDIVDGKCHSCSDGYAMQVLEHVHSGKKCGKVIPGSFAKATKIGPPCGKGKLWDPRGECWSCPDDFLRTVAPVTTSLACEYMGRMGIGGCQTGLSSIRGTCRRTGECGKATQRPCEIGERIPSCDPNLKEDFKQNLCVPLRTGETPFTGGLSSLSGYLGAKMQAHCKELLGGIPMSQDTFGVGARCGRDVAAGFACVLARDIALGYPDLINSIMEKSPEGASLAEQMNAAANRPPCKELGESFAKATKHAKATGKVLPIECPAGQFWDPDGFCYSCPKDYTRTLFPVSDARSCTDQVGGNLKRFACGAYQGIAKKLEAPVDCTVEVLEDGSLFDRKIDLSKASQVACMATGELGYYIVRTGIEGGKAVATGDISGLLSTIGKAAGAASKATNLNRLMECSKKK